MHRTMRRCEHIASSDFISSFRY